MHITNMVSNPNHIPWLHCHHRARRIGRVLGLVDRAGGADWVAIFLAMLTTAVLLSGLLLGGSFFYLYFIDDRVPAEISSIQIIDETAVPGQRVHLAVSLCRYTDAPVILSVAWVDGVRYLAPAISPPSLKPGCYDGIPLLLDVPSLPAGNYALELQFLYAVNFMRDRPVFYKTNYIYIRGE